MAKKPKRWGDKDDAKLCTLFRKGANKGGLNPKLLTSKDIHKVIDRHFPGAVHKSFCRTYGTRARAWLLEQELAGARKKKGMSYVFLFVHQLI